MLSGVNMEGSLRGRDVRKLNTQGCCFLCLKPNKTTPGERGETDVTKPELIRQQMSIQCLARYLQVNLDEMEQATSSAGMSTTGSKPEVDVEVDLCECCEKLASRFSSLFQQLERIQTELEYYLEEIRFTVLRSSKTPELVRNYSREMTSHIDSVSQLVLVNKLRNEIREKGLKTRRTPTVSLKKSERLPKEEVPDPVEDEDSADFDKQAFSSMENCAVQDSVSNFDQRSGIKKEPEDSSVISPKKYLKQSMKEKSHRSEVEFRKAISKLIKTLNIDIEFESEGEDIAENVDDTGVCLPDLRASPTSSSRPTEDHQEDLKLGFTDNQTPSFMPPVKVKHKESMYYTKDLSTGMYECKKCEKTSKCQTTIARHFKSVHLKLRYKCDICNNAVLKGSSSLKKHKKTCAQKVVMELAKGIDRRFICKDCGKRFDTKEKLGYHTRNVHLNANRFQCYLCDKKYTRPVALKNHQVVIHQARKLFCKICNKMYLDLTKFSQHEKKCEDMANLPVESVSGG